MKVKKIQERKGINLKLQNKKKQKLKEKGITLIALVVTIIILLILAGVTLNMALSGDGLFSKAKVAVNKYDVASEQEVLQQQIIEYQMDNSTVKIGEELADRVSGVTDSNWKVIQLNNSDKNYGTNYYYVPKGKEIANYGQTKYNWVINYETGEIINIEEYTVLDGNAGISVIDNLPLNINPVNLGAPSKWGNNIKFVGNDDNSENSGVHGTELKFDGKDDYLRIDNVEIQTDEGFTFEFFGRDYNSSVFPFEKIKFNGDKIDDVYLSSFRMGLEKTYLGCCFGVGNCGSGLAESNGVWFDFSDVGLCGENSRIYFSISVNLKNGKVSLFFNGNGKTIKSETNCNLSYFTDR